MIGATIAALITSSASPVRSAIRVSGPDVPSICEAWQPGLWKATYGCRRVDLQLEELVVPTLVLTLPEGRSYTREMVVELHFPSNPNLSRWMLEQLFRLGAHPAGPGEFTRRAFLNGRLDLDRARSVAALIQAEDDDHHREALKMMSGHRGDLVEEIKAEVFAFRRDLEAVIDFPEEPDIESRQWRWRQAIDALQVKAKTWQEQGQAQVDGPATLEVLLLGPANAGKSHLIKALVPGSQPVISHVAGTTLDLIPYPVQVGGAQLHLFDSPGLKDIEGELDAISQERLHQRMAAFDAYLMVLPLGQEEPEWPTLRAGASVLRLASKADLGHGDEGDLRVSAYTGEGLGALKSKLEAWAMEHRERAPRPLLALRSNLLQLTTERIARVDALLFEEGGGEELAAYELDELLDGLDGLLGEEGGNEALLDSVFRDFCIGK